MTTKEVVFDFQPQRVVFKAAPKEPNTIQFNMLYNNKKISNTEPWEISPNQKQVNLSHLGCLSFDTTGEINKYPIMVYVLYGSRAAKKIILKRSEMMKKYELEEKDEFSFQDDSELFSLWYRVGVRPVGEGLAESGQFIKEVQLLERKGLPPKPQESLSRSIKRPAMIEVGARVERIRKSSMEQKQSSGSQVKIEVDLNDSVRKSQTKKQQQSVSKMVPGLTLSKEQENKEVDLVKKDVKVNLFETFNPKEVKEKNINEVKVIKSHRTQNSTERDHPSSAHDAHVPVNKSQRGGHSAHKKSEQHHDSHGHDSHGHDDHHGHEQSHPLSLKLKTVIVMLIVGFLFLMYDALDDRFSRKVVRKATIVHHQEDLHHQVESKKKKTSKKQKKVGGHH